MNAKDILKTVFGYDTFWPLQEQIIAHLLKKRDALVVMPTGGGKSLCYQIPGMIFDGLTIVVSPLISLMKDQVDQLREYGVPALFLNSSLSVEEYRKNVVKLKNNEVKLLYVSPENLLAPRTLSLLTTLDVDCIAIDEAHCISEWGHDFRPEYRQLAEVRAVFPDACCAALTATATPRVREDIRQSLHINTQGEYVGSFNRPNLFLEVLPKAKPFDQALTLINQYPNESGIIYCATRRQTDELYTLLVQKGYAALPYHAGLSEKERTENQERFSRDDVRIIAATIAFGMGINKPNVRFVVHYDLPGSIDNYYQEIGRAGRDGLPAHCLLLFSYGDIRKVRYFIEQKTKQEQMVANILLNRLMGFVETDMCRRVSLLNYFGETNVPDRCGMCDNCRMSQDEKDLTDLTIPAQMFLSCVKRTDEIFGAGHIMNVLRGSKDQKVLKFRHEQLSTYGIGRSYSTNQWRQIARQLTHKGLLKNDYEHGSLKLTRKAWDVLRGKESFFGKLEETGKEQGAPQRQRAGDTETFDAELFEILRTKRKEIADQENMPPYVIFHDRTLREMAFYYPQSKESLMTLHGIGQRKLEKYAGVFLEMIKEYCRTHQIPEKEKPPPADQFPAAAPPPNGGLRHMVIGEQFNEGRTIEQLATDFGIKQNTVIDNLYRYQQNHHPLNGKHLLTYSHLTESERQSALSSFARLGTERLRPVFEDLQGTISYEELKILQLFLLCEKPISAGNRKTFIVLAASRKYGGYCIAGKEWADEKIGPWLRPVSRQENGELAAEAIRLDSGHIPRYLDVITIETQGADDHPRQKENILIADKHLWSWQCRLSPDALPQMVDKANELWQPGFHSITGINDRVPEDALREADGTSLYLIRPDDFTILVSDDPDGRKKIRSRFSYRGIPYLLSVTDPVIERTYLMKNQGEYPLNAEEVYLTVSLSEPFNGYCYKLAAAVLIYDKD
ncbi:MAG: DNA helicase RecQ [Deltaproteobacteria bacterium]|nr:DNA helicase RecQ [Deltaproteobacteria bacterium]